MSKVTKQRLLSCKTTAEKLATVLNDKKGHTDVTEFYQTLRYVVSVLDEFTKTKSKDRPSVPDEGVKIEQLLKEYDAFLTKLVASGRFNRFFTSLRVRKSLDQINSQLFKENSKISTELHAKRKKKATIKGEDIENYTEALGDQDAKALWATKFGPVVQ
jgi:hypothetical protein